MKCESSYRRGPGTAARRAVGVAAEARVMDAARAADEASLSAMLAKDGQTLLPILELIVSGRTMIDEVIGDIGRATIGALLELSAREVAGAPAPGRRDADPARGGVHRFGYQEGVVPLGDRTLRVRKPRLRTRAAPGTPSREAAVPAYETLKSDPRAGARVMALLSRGVSTRDYAKAIPEMAGTLGVSKSSVSREFIERTETAHDELMTRRFDHAIFPVILIDGKLFGEHHLITALGIDDAGAKHILGIAHGASENAEVVKELLRSLVERGVKPGPVRLFIVDGSKAIRSAISEVFGSENPVQRCVAHKVRNVQDQLPREQRKYAKMVITAAVRMEPAKGIEKLRAYAKELGERWPGAAASLREGLDDLFTVSRLRLPELLAAALRTTNIIESGQSLIGKFTGRVKNWKTPGMALRWHAAACLDAEKRMKRIRGSKHLALLGAALGTTLEKIRKVA